MSHLILVPLDKNNMDMAGHIFPLNGHILAKEFSLDHDISNGFFGSFLGKTPIKNLKEIDNGKWAVVSIDDSENYIKISTIDNWVKFSKGMIVISDKLQTCLDFIEEERICENSICK